MRHRAPWSPVRRRTSLDRVLRSPNVRHVLDNLPAWLRTEVEADDRFLQWAAAPRCPTGPPNTLSLPVGLIAS